MTEEIGAITCDSDFEARQTAHAPLLWFIPISACA